MRPQPSRGSGESSVTFFLWSKGGDCKSALIACAPWLPEGRSWPGRKGRHKRAVWARPDATGRPPYFALLFIAIGPSGYWALGISMRLNSLLFLVSLSCPFAKIVWWRLGRSGGSRASQSRCFGGRFAVRCKALYMATVVATRFEPLIRDFYQRLLSKGKPYKIAVTACMRKLLTILNARMRDFYHWCRYRNLSNRVPLDAKKRLWI